MITHRRVFHARAGRADDVVNKLTEFLSIFRRYDGPESRIYTDFLSGDTDRVVWEFDVADLGSLESLYWKISQDNDAFKEWEDGLYPLIEKATAELWHREL